MSQELVSGQEKVKNCLEHKAVEVRSSPVHRYGVFATRKIFPKEIIEECPVIVIPRMKNSPENLSTRLFYWDENNASIVLGYGSMYNHSDEANAAYAVDRQHSLMQYVATKTIEKDEEIFINYGADWFPAYFNRRSLNNFRVHDDRKRFRRAAIIFGFVLLAVAFMFLSV